MAAVSVTASFENFFKSVGKRPPFALLADYDGTLAPFVVDRALARPHRGIRELLLRLAVNGIRVAIVSGRPAREVQQLLGINSIEIWGSHGAERLLSTGEHIEFEARPNTSLAPLLEALSHEQLSSLVEAKPFGVMVHCRGLSQAEAREVRFAATHAFQSLPPTNLELFEVDGGLEFRPRSITKANAVRKIRQEQPCLPLIYMGDDLTDEDAFRALDETDLSILVRPEYRPTAAHVWLKPPEQLTALLHFLTYATGGPQ